jgi:hypothetical protein
MTFHELAEITASVIVSLGGGGAITFGLSGYLGKIWAGRALQKQQQEYAQLNLQLTSQLGLVTEERKHLLQLRQLEHQVRFSKLHEKRAEVIAQIYRQLVETENEIKRFVLYQQGRRAPGEPIAADQKLRDFNIYVDTHRIYFPEEIYDLLVNFHLAVIEPLAHAVAFGDIESHDATFQMQKQEGFKHSREAFQSNIPAVRKALEHEFRLLLGDKQSVLRLPPTTT